MSVFESLKRKSPEEITKFWKEHEAALALRRKKFEPNTVRIFSYENFQQNMKSLRSSNDGKYTAILREDLIALFENDNIECGIASAKLRRPADVKFLCGDNDVYICDTHLIVTFSKLFLIYKMPTLDKYVNVVFDGFIFHAELSADSKYFYAMNSDAKMARIPLDNIDFTKRNFIIEPQYYSEFKSYHGFGRIEFSAFENDLFCMHTSRKLIVVKKDFDKREEHILYTLNVTGSQYILGAKFECKRNAMNGEILEQYICVFGEEKEKDSQKSQGLFQMLKIPNMEYVVDKILPFPVFASACMLDENAKGLFLSTNAVEHIDDHARKHLYYISFDLSRMHSICKGARGSLFVFHPSKRQLYLPRPVYDQFGSKFIQLFSMFLSHRLCGLEAPIFYLTALKYVYTFGDTLKDLEMLHMISFFDSCTGRTNNCIGEHMTYNAEEFFFNLSYYEQKQLVRGAALRDWPKRTKLWQDAFQHAQRLHLSRPHFSAAILALEAFFDLFY